MSIENSFDAETRETVNLEERIKVYQRDRSNLELKRDLLEQIRARAMFLLREEFVKRASARPNRRCIEATSRLHGRLGGKTCLRIWQYYARFGAVGRERNCATKTHF